MNEVRSNILKLYNNYFYFANFPHHYTFLFKFFEGCTFITNSTFVFVFPLL